MSDTVTTTEKTPEELAAEKALARQLELQTLKEKLEEAQENRDLAKGAYDAVLAQTSGLAKERVALEKQIREEAKARLAAFDANVNTLKKAKGQASVHLAETERTLLDLGNAWDRVKGEYVETAPATETTLKPAPGSVVEANVLQTAPVADVVEEEGIPEEPADEAAEKPEGGKPAKKRKH